MDILETLRLIAATGCGLQIGGFLLLSLLHKPLIETWPQNIELAWLFKRFYRFNTVISVISGIFAIFGEARTTGFLLAIMGMSYILLLTHLIPAILNQHQAARSTKPLNLRRSPAEIISLLGKVQTSIHFLQLLLLLYLVYRLSY